MMTDDQQWEQDFKRAKCYRSALDKICDIEILDPTNTIAHTMRGIAKEAIANFMSEGVE